jgi:hypothetical protein
MRLAVPAVTRMSSSTSNRPPPDLPRAGLEQKLTEPRSVGDFTSAAASGVWARVRRNSSCANSGPILNASSADVRSTRRDAVLRGRWGRSCRRHRAHHAPLARVGQSQERELARVRGPSVRSFVSSNEPRTRGSNAGRPGGRGASPQRRATEHLRRVPPIHGVAPGPLGGWCRSGSGTPTCPSSSTDHARRCSA